MAKAMKAPELKLSQFLHRADASGNTANEEVESFLDLIDFYWPKFKRAKDAMLVAISDEYRHEKIIELEEQVQKLEPIGNTILEGFNREKKEHLDMLRNGDHNTLMMNSVNHIKEFKEHADIAVSWLRRHDDFVQACKDLKARKGKGLTPKHLTEDWLNTMYGSDGYDFLLAFCALQAIREVLLLKLPNGFLNSMTQAYIPKPKVIKMTKKLLDELRKDGVDETSLEPIQAALTRDYSEIDVSKALVLRRVSPDLIMDRVIDAIGGTLSALFDFSHTLYGRPYVNVSESLLRLCGLQMSGRNLERRLEKFDQK